MPLLFQLLFHELFQLVRQLGSLLALLPDLVLGAGVGQPQFILLAPFPASTIRSMSSRFSCL